MIKVGFDISQTAHPGGVGVYTNNLATGLMNSSELEMCFFYSSFRKPYKGELKKVKKFKLPPSLFEVLFNRIRNFPIEKFVGDVDIFHSSDWVQPPSRALKITTYHDLIPIKFPGWSNPKIVDVQRRRLKIVEREIDMVIAVSEATKKDLLDVSTIPESKIRVVYEGVEGFFEPKKKEQTEKFRKKMNLPEKFILAFGGVGDRKNLENIKKAAKDYKLVIAGETIPFVLRTELPYLYNAAEILLYPSLYEGFGLPVLEAMACGVPVITSDNSSLKEVGGEAVVYADPHDPESLAKTVQNVMEDTNLQNTLSQKGLERSKHFSWEKCTEETVKIYKELAKK